jgi:hypothetical protein
MFEGATPAVKSDRAKLAAVRTIEHFVIPETVDEQVAAHNRIRRKT